MKGLTSMLIFCVLMITLVPARSWGELAEGPGRTWVEIGGEIYGARPDERGPIGGGKGYRNVITDGNFRVRTVDELAAALKTAQPGQTVFVPGDAELDCADQIFAEDFHVDVPGGVTLAGDRGFRGSPGALIYSDAFATKPLVRILGPGVRITGLRLRGPDPKRRLEHHQRSFNKDRGDDKQQHDYYYRLPVSQGIRTESDELEVDNCELSGWSHVAVFLSAGRGHRIHHNYIHHNQLNGLGYGISHGYNPSASLIECNLFNFNRHSIAATGAPGNSYEARNNVELGESLSHNFDMHGGRDRKDGTEIAGDLIRIQHNTFLGSKVRAVVVRGVPREEARIDHNWFAHERADENLIRPWPLTPESRIFLENNAYGLRHPLVRDRKAEDQEMDDLISHLMEQILTLSAFCDRHVISCHSLENGKLLSNPESSRHFGFLVRFGIAQNHVESVDFRLERGEPDFQQHRFIQPKHP